MEEGGVARKTAQVWVLFDTGLGYWQKPGNVFRWSSDKRAARLQSTCVWSRPKLRGYWNDLPDFWAETHPMNLAGNISSRLQFAPGQLWTWHGREKMLVRLVVDVPAAAFSKTRLKMRFQCLLRLGFEWKDRLKPWFGESGRFSSVSSVATLPSLYSGLLISSGSHFLICEMKRSLRGFCVKTKSNSVCEALCSSSHIVINNKNVAKYYCWLCLIIIKVCYLKSNNAPFTFKWLHCNLCNIKHYSI